MRRLSISPLNKIENDVNQLHNRWADRASGNIGPRLSVLMFQCITPEFAYPSVPKPASADDLLQADALIWAQRYPIQSSKSLS